MLFRSVIALVTLTLLVVANRRLGVSSGLEDVCSLVLERPYFQRGAVLSGRPWRLPFMAGLLLGGTSRDLPLPPGATVRIEDGRAVLSGRLRP